jgi:hypothetical protein
MGLGSRLWRLGRARGYLSPEQRETVNQQRWDHKRKMVKPTLTAHQQREARKRLADGETQRSVARSCNVSQSTISRLL